MESKRKNDIFYFILLILTMITMVVGITFTYFGLVAKEKEDSTRIKAGSLSINYVDGMTIDTYALMPINEPNLNTKYSVYKKKFTVASDGTLDQTLDLYIKVTKNTFANNALKFALYDSTNSKIADGYIPNKEGATILMAEDVYLKNNNSKNFTVLIWLQENNQNQSLQIAKEMILFL